jgi:FtsP/CotA-like multicopper oxidase with cupredoxin domain
VRRATLLRAGGAVALAAIAAPFAGRILAEGQPGTLLPSGAPRPPAFRVPLPVPPVLAPARTDATTDSYEITQRTARLPVLPGLTTEAWTYGGSWPGPTIVSRAGRRTVVRHRNHLPEPVVVHLHGGHTPAESDGYPMDLIVPVGAALPAGHEVADGYRDYGYPLNQRAATLWYHDHRMGRTGPNVWRGLAGFHVVHDDEEDALPLPRGDRDLPMMITDRSFAADGSFRYRTAGHMNGVLGDVLLVNGAPWPVHPVDRARYRLRLLNASNARRYRLALDPPPPGGDAFVQIGSDGGLLARPVRHDWVDIAPAERFDVLVDFARYPAGTRVRLVNRLGAGRCGEVMRFDVGSGTGDDSRIPATLSRTADRPDPSRAVATRTFVFRQAFDGTWMINNRAYQPGAPLARPRLGTTEVWRFVTDFHHPVHVHLDPFQVLSRNGFGPGTYDAGWKDTVDVKPAGAVEIVTRFTDYPGRFLLHCHNLEHEDMAMMADFDTA